MRRRRILLTLRSELNSRPTFFSSALAVARYDAAMLPQSRQPRASTSKVPSRKRATKEDSEEEFADSLKLDRDLAFASDEDDDEGAAMDDDAESDDEDGEAFPEIAFEDSDEADFQGDGDEEEDSDSAESLGLIDPEEEAALLAEIEAEDAQDDLDSDSQDPLTDLICRNTYKPYEDDARASAYEDPELLKDFMRRSKVVVSDITGQEKTQWEEEIDAGYGSDSSTEEVSITTVSHPYRTDRVLR